MILVDVHAHMDMEGYDMYGGADKVIEECEANGVRVIVCNGVDIDSNRKVLDICSRHDICKPALGIYPTHCLEHIEKGEKDLLDSQLLLIEKLVAQKKAIAIGEVGLDYYDMKDLSENQKDIMKDCFRRFIEIAKRYDVPIIVHSRKAELETIEFLESSDMKGRKVIMHCFSGRKHHVQRIRDNGWYFSIPCNVDRSQQFQEIVRDTPLDQIFTETDAPLLSPILGKSGRPDFVRLSIKKIAEIKGMEPEEVANIIYNNYQKVFL